MLKFSISAISGLLLLAAAHVAQAQVEFNTDKNREVKQLRATGFLDYPPFGFIPNQYYPDSYQSIFKVIVNEYSEQANFLTDYTVNFSYDVLVRKVRGGEIDIIMGIYHETEQYADLEYVFPALINNPIVVIMLPDRINEVKDTGDLRNLKGAISQNEHLSDFVSRELEKFNLVKADSSYNLYKKLYTKEVDYVLASEYNARIELAKLGLRGQLSFSQSPLWNAPLFLGVSKASPYRNQVKNGLTRLVTQPESREKIKKALTDYIGKVEQESVGIVPPDFTK